MARKRKLPSLPEIIFEDQFFLAVNKPSFWTVLYATGRKTAFQKWLEKKVFFALENGDFRKRSGIVHRLDKDTSGLILVAKDSLTFADLQKAFAKRLIKKEYLALVRGKAPVKGIIKAPIKRAIGQKNKWRVFPKGREATTFFYLERLYNYRGNFFSLLKVRPRSGRTHQIRVHFKYLGFPLAGDPLYGFGKDKDGPGRLFLHASRLEFVHPKTGRKVSFKSQLPLVLREYLARLLRN